jgi:hypothetical protein
MRSDSWSEHFRLFELCVTRGRMVDVFDGASATYTDPSPADGQLLLGSLTYKRRSVSSHPISRACEGRA